MRKNVFYNLLIALTCFDSLFILSYGGIQAWQNLACGGWESFTWTILFYPIHHLFLMGSIYMTVAISLERYLGICHTHLQFSRGALLYILPVTLISSAYALPMFLWSKFSIVNGKLVFEYQDVKYARTYHHFLASVILLSILPFVALLFLNGSIIVTIKRSMDPPRTHDRRNSTNILFCVVIIFLILHLPRLISNFAHFDHWIASWSHLGRTESVALIMNSSVNFVIYTLVSRNFRTQFVQIFQCKKAPASNTNTSGGRKELF